MGFFLHFFGRCDLYSGVTYTLKYTVIYSFKCFACTRVVLCLFDFKANIQSGHTVIVFVRTSSNGRMVERDTLVPYTCYTCKKNCKANKQSICKPAKIIIIEILKLGSC